MARPQGLQIQASQLTDVVQQSTTGVKIQMQTEFNDTRGEIRHAANSIEGKVEAVQIALFDFGQTVEERIALEVANQLSKQSKRREHNSITTHLDPELFSKIINGASQSHMTRSAYVAEILRNVHNSDC